MLEVLVASVSTIDTKLLSPNHLSSCVPLSTLAFQLCKYIATYNCWSLTFVACLFFLFFCFCFRFFSCCTSAFIFSNEKNFFFGNMLFSFFLLFFFDHIFSFMMTFLFHRIFFLFVSIKTMLLLITIHKL